LTTAEVLAVLRETAPGLSGCWTEEDEKKFRDSPFLRPWKGISGLTLGRAGVTVDGELVKVPYYRADYNVHNTRVFSASGRCWWQEKDLELLPYGLELLHSAPDDCPVLVSEGESDCLAIREAFPDCAVFGVPGAKTWRPEWAMYLERFLVVYAIGDGDQPGQDLNRSIVRDIPWARSVKLPAGEDARSILQRDGARALDPYLGEAEHLVRVWAAFRLTTSIEECEALLYGDHWRAVA
jgi:hypothetical protein